jgi:uncharacterized membrane protein
MAQTKNNDRKMWAIIAYFIFFLPLLTEYKDDKFVKFHVGQGLVLLIASLVIWFLSAFIPIIGWFIIGPIGSIVLFVCWIIGILNAASDKEQPVPIIGSLAEKFKF